MAALAAAAAAWLAAAATPAFALGPSPFSDWAAIFVAGDWHAHSGGPTEAFDNARRDLAQAFEAAGFRHENIRQFSTRPERYADTAPFPSELQTINDALDRLTEQARGGCLIYFTSHGSPDGALVGRQILPPKIAAQIVGQACGTRPTVVVVSTCFSGVFVPELAAPNRMVLTAARPDRSSFGCSESDKYPYFDACMLESLPTARDFAALGRAAQGCVAKRERQEGLTPPSEPQMAVGGELLPELALMGFAAPARAGGPTLSAAAGAALGAAGKIAP